MISFQFRNQGTAILPLYANAGRDRATMFRIVPALHGLPLLVLVKLSHRPQDLAYQDFGGIIVASGQVIATGRFDDFHTKLAELRKDDLAHQKVAGKPVSTFNQNHPDSVALDLIEESGEPIPAHHFGGAAYTLLLELLNNRNAAGTDI